LRTGWGEKDTAQGYLVDLLLDCYYHQLHIGGPLGQYASYDLESVALRWDWMLFGLSWVEDFA